MQYTRIETDFTSLSFVRHSIMPGTASFQADFVAAAYTDVSVLVVVQRGDNSSRLQPAPNALLQARLIGHRLTPFLGIFGQHELVFNRHVVSPFQAAQ